MRLPFPEQIPIRYALYFAVLLCIAQLLQGTPAAISLCCFLFILIATFTFNLAGGFSRPSGGYVFFYAVLTVIVGIFWKAILGEAADTNLKQPLLTFEIYVGGITAMLGAVYFGRMLTTKRPILAEISTGAAMVNASVGCLIVGLVLAAAENLTTLKSGSLLSAVHQVDIFLPLAIILGVIAQIRRSGGTSSVNLPVLLAGGVTLAFGFINFSKAGIFTPPFCWLVAAASQRYRVTFYQIMGFLLLTVFMGYYFVPYSEYGRNYKTESFSGNASLAISLLSSLDYVRQQSEQSADAVVEDRVQAYYDTPQGLLDRFQMISVDDLLNSGTEDNGPIGFYPIVLYLENLIPHFIWAGKPEVGFGNLYARQLGLIGADNTTTGISFSPTGEAFHLGRWVGVLIAAPLVWMPLFIVFDSLCGDTRKAPWGLLTIVVFAHAAPEGMLGSTIHVLGYFSFGVVFAAVVSTYVMPILGALVSVPERTRLRRIAPIRSIPRRLPPVHPPQNSGQ